MINVLMISSNLKTNGITSVILNYGLFHDDSRLNITVATGNPQKDSYIKQLNEKNIKVHLLINRKKHPIKYRRQLKKLIKENNFDIVHVHGNSSTMVLELAVAKKCGVKVRIAHCHNSQCKSMLRHKLLSPFFRKSYTHAFACSKLAGDWIFGEGKFEVLNNGINSEHYKFNSDARNSVRAELGVDKDIVIGHVGLFNDQKNHSFLLDAFEQLAKANGNVKLLLVGSGYNFDIIKSRVDASEYKDKVIFAGDSDRVPDLLSAMDVMVLPSKFEGLGLVLIEGQASGLNCIASDKVPLEANITGHIDYLPLNVSDWVNKLAEVQPTDTALREKVSAENALKIKQANYDIQANCKFLEDLYKKYINN